MGYYLYLLRDNNTVIYVGITRDLYTRYAEHCTLASYCSSYIYHMRQGGKLPALEIVGIYHDRAGALGAEFAIIQFCASIGHKLLNSEANPEHNRLTAANPYPNPMPCPRVKPLTYNSITDTAIYNYLIKRKQMSQQTVNIDFSRWITQQALANELGVTVQCVNNWIRRNKIASRKIEGSRLVLVDRTTAPTVNPV